MISEISVYWDGRPTNNPKPSWINVGAKGSCRDDPRLEGQLFRHGNALENVNGPVDVMMVCRSSLQAWRENPQLQAERNTKFDTRMRSLDNFKSTASGLILIHELSHSIELAKEEHASKHSLCLISHVGFNL